MGSESGLLLQVESGNAVGLGEGVALARSEHHKSLGDVWGPGRGVMIGNSGFERLPGSDDALLGFVPGFVRHGLARIFALLYAGTGGGRGLTAENDLVIDQQAPASGTFDPNAQDVRLVAAGHHRSHLTVRALFHLRSAFVAKCGSREGGEDFSSGTSFSIGVRPGKIRVEDSAERSGVTFPSGLDKFVVGLEKGL